MRELWWDELGLGSSDFWRMWTARWSVPESRRLPAHAAGPLTPGGGEASTSTNPFPGG